MNDDALIAFLRAREDDREAAESDPDPRLTADIVIRRRIINLCESYGEYADFQPAMTEVLKLLSLRDAGHPEFNPSWRTS